MKKIVVLTGAGMSADSGLQTFRDSNGLWEGHEVRQVATVDAWRDDPEKVLAFYNERRKQAHQVDPHAGHRALASLEENFEVTIITQNVDSLHEQAGSSNVIHLHGELSKVRSVEDDSLIKNVGGDPIHLGDTAEDGGQLRPHVVWFGEMVPNMEVAAEIMPMADILLVIGTSLVVYPAAALIDYASRDIPKFMVDPAEPDRSIDKHWQHIKENAAEGVPALAKKLKSDYEY